MIQLPQEPESINVRVLAQRYRERFTGLVSATITLQFPPIRAIDDVGLEIIVKNGVVLDPGGGAAGYSIAGPIITLGTAAINTDVFLVHYYYRA